MNIDRAAVVAKITDHIIIQLVDVGAIERITVGNPRSAILAIRCNTMLRNRADAARAYIKIVIMHIVRLNISVRAGGCIEYITTGTSAVYEIMAEGRAIEENRGGVRAHVAASAGVIIDRGGRAGCRLFEGSRLFGLLIIDVGMRSAAIGCIGRTAVSRAAASTTAARGSVDGEVRGQ